MNNLTSAQLDLVASILNNSKTPGGAGYLEVLKKTGWSAVGVVKSFTQGVNHIAKKVGASRRNKFFAEASSKNKLHQGWIQGLERVIGANPNGIWETADQPALYHVLDHAFGRSHDFYADRPWSPLTAAEDAAKGQIRANELNAEFRRHLIQFATWGLQDLVEKLFEIGPAEGMEIARSASRSRDQATRLNAAYGDAKKFEGDAGLDLVKFIGAVSASSQPPGIRDVARQLKVPDFAVVQLFDKAQGSMGGVPASKLSRLIQEIELFRKGLFYARTGGRVPGTGSRDTVPAMLTPGEFVLRKSAAQSLGPEVLASLNRFGAGGAVLGMSSPAVPQLHSVNRVSSLSDSSSQVINNTYEFNTVINNPVGENSVASLNRNLRRKASLGVFSAGQQD